MVQYLGLIASIVSVTAIILVGVIGYYARKDRDSIDKEFADIRGDIVGNANDLIAYKQMKDTSCSKHFDTIQRMEIEIGKRKGESDLLAKDIKRLEDTMELRLKAIEKTGDETKKMVEKIYDALYTLNIKK